MAQWTGPNFNGVKFNGPTDVELDRQGNMYIADFGNFLKTLSSAGVVAVIGGQGGSRSAGMNLTHTGILGFDADFAIPIVSMTNEDQGQLERLLERGITPRMHINVQNAFTNGPVETAAAKSPRRFICHPFFIAAP